MAAAHDQQASTRATGVVGIAILCSRVLGLIREQVFAGLFGAGKNLDAFLMAFRVPNLLRDLFAEGALSTAFITTFSKKIATEGDASAWQLANKVVTLTAVFMSTVTLLGIIFAPQLVDLLTWWSWPPDKTALTISLTRIMWPFMFLVSLAALVMGMLNAKHVFGAPAMASSYFNLGSAFSALRLARSPCRSCPKARRSETWASFAPFSRAGYGSHFCSPSPRRLAWPCSHRRSSA